MRRIGNPPAGPVVLLHGHPRTHTTWHAVACPTLLLESEHDDLDIHGNPARIWAPWLHRPLSDEVIPSGHHQAEEAPDEVARALFAFLDGLLVSSRPS